MTSRIGRLAGKTAFVTAARQGIGRASVERYANEGARIIARDINNESLAVYLASEESKFTTGQTFAIDGGWSL